MYRYLFIIIVSWASTAYSAYALKDGKLIQEEHVPTMSVQEHHSAAIDALHNRRWEELIQQAMVIRKNFSGTPFSQEALYFLGRGYLELTDYDLANQYFSQYLKRHSAPKYFQDAMQGKLEVAEQFSRGAGKHVMGISSLPKWMPAYDEALKIFDEVATAMPNHELAARALIGKAMLLYTQEDFKTAIEHLQTLIRRFPKNDFAAQAFLEINRFYLRQAEREFPDPDFLELAEINLRKFHGDFPNDPRLEAAQKFFFDMEELYARSLYETAQFFERTKKPHAALIYYQRIQRDFATTPSAYKAQARIEVLQPKEDSSSSGEIANR
jgi:outer membrane protein assembly factor BamD (BamD/ComL family)